MDYESLSLLVAVYHAECVPVTSYAASRLPLFSPQPLAILEAAQNLSWYQDGLTTIETERLLAFYDNYLRLPANNPGELLGDALARGTYSEVTFDNAKRQILIVTGDPLDVALQIASFHSSRAPQIDSLLGPLPVTSLAVHLQEERNSHLCGRSFLDSFSVMVNPFCVDFGWTYALLHELAHLYIGIDYPVWYAEGMAHVWASLLNGNIEELKVKSSEILAANSGATKLTVESRRDDDGSKQALGFLFLRRVMDVHGVENLAAMTRDLKPNASGDEILAAIRKYTPSSKREVVEALLSEYFGF